MDVVRTASTRGFPGVGASIRHHVAVVLVTCVIGISLGSLYALSLNNTYTSTAVMLLSPSPGNPLTAETASGSSVQLTVAMETEAQLLQSGGVRDLVSERIGRQVPAGDETLVVEVPANTQMLKVAFTSRSPESARTGAQEFATGYLEYREERAATTQQARIEALGQQIEATDANLRRATDDAAEDGVTSYAAREVQLFADRLAQLNNGLSAAEAVGTAPGSILSPAVQPDGSNELPLWAYVAVAAGLGLALGVLVAVIWEWRRDLVRADAASQDFGPPVFANIPRSPSSPVALSDDLSPAHEAYRGLRAGVIANAPWPHVLAVSSVDGHPSSEVATNLALALAEAKFSVLLIAANPHATDIDQILDISRRAGLSEIVMGAVPLQEGATVTHGITVITRGLAPSNCKELTAGPAFRKLIQQTRQEFDYLIVDAAGTGSADGDSAMLAADSALLVLTPDRTRGVQLVSSLERLEQLGVPALGSVMASPPRPGHTATSDSLDSGGAERREIVPERVRLRA